ncbi:MAG: hypothetical protein IJM03_03055 [Treponema sp.]|nr:hypothetical protein [Treponema sp.]
MENSCRKKYKQSSKNWVLASRHTGFRRNSALVPANAGLYHYALNCPVRYIDPTGKAGTMKLTDNKYVFVPAPNVWILALNKGAEFFPFGTTMRDLAYESSGEYQLIDLSDNDDFFDSYLGSVISFMSEYSDIKFLEDANRGVSIAQKILTGIKVVAVLFDRNSVAEDIIMDELFHDQLSSTSHKNVSNLYKLGKYFMKRLQDKDFIKITPTFSGGVERYEIKNNGEEIIEIMKSLLELYKKHLEDGE